MDNENHHCVPFNTRNAILGTEFVKILEVMMQTFGLGRFFPYEEEATDMLFARFIRVYFACISRTPTLISL